MSGGHTGTAEIPVVSFDNVTKVYGKVHAVNGLTLHGILVLPGLAWLLSFADMPERRRVRVIAWTTAAYAVAVAAAIVYSLTRAFAG